MIIVLTIYYIPSIFPLINNLVGGLKYVLFSIIYGINLPIDVYIFQDGLNHQPVIITITIITY
jgi:hypothetical protein